MSSPENSKTGAGPSLTSAELELLLLLLMCPETAEELGNMLVEDDRRELLNRSQTGAKGVTLALKRLERRGLVTWESEVGIEGLPQEVWRLTEVGRGIAGGEAAKLHEWDMDFRAELIRQGMDAETATRAIGEVSDRGDNHGDPIEVARRYRRRMSLWQP